MKSIMKSIIRGNVVIQIYDIVLHIISKLYFNNDTICNISSLSSPLSGSLEFERSAIRHIGEHLIKREF